jgi:DNA-binding MarR family transcriptional regulator
MQSPQPLSERWMGLISRLEGLSLGRPPLAEVGLTLPQFGLLRCVWLEPGIRLNQVADKLGVTMPTVSVAVRKLEEGGWLERKSDNEDKRSVRLHLSPKALAIAKRLGLHQRRIIKAFMNALSPEEQEQLMNLLEKAITNLEKEQPSQTRSL